MFQSRRTKQFKKQDTDGCPYIHFEVWFFYLVISRRCQCKHYVHSVDDRMINESGAVEGTEVLGENPFQCHRQP
jgi:hypothetical protein